MTSFSERFGYRPTSFDIQSESMDDALRVGLWNVFCEHFFSQANLHNNGYYEETRGPLEVFMWALWRDYFRWPNDTRPKDFAKQYGRVREYVLEKCSWNEAYDFLEFAASHAFSPDHASTFGKRCNGMLERERAAWRFAGKHLMRVTDSEAVEAVNNALELPNRLGVARTHLDSAVRMLSDRKAPDFRNSIKESISAVEAVCSLLAGQDKADLGAAIRVLEKQGAMHGALKKAFSNLYGYTSDAEGIRHALLDEPNLTLEDAQFMLVACCAFINYLKSAAARLGLMNTG